MMGIGGAAFCPKWQKKDFLQKNMEEVTPIDKGIKYSVYLEQDRKEL